MEQAFDRAAQRLFPLAALYLGSLEEARAAVIEAIAAAWRKNPEDQEPEALPQLLRICRTRAPERVDTHDFPADPALEPLLPVLKLPAGSRRNLALSVTGFSQEAAAALGLTAKEQQEKTEKALRQLTFMQGGSPPQNDLLEEAARHLPWTEDAAFALRTALDEIAAPQLSGDDAVRSITQTPGSRYGKSVSVPIWGIALCVISVIVLTAALIFQIAAHKTTFWDEPPAVYPNEIRFLLAKDYLDIDAAQQKAAEAAEIPAGSAVFLATKLNTDASPAVYEITCTGGSVTEFTLTLDAQSGEILSQESREVQPFPHMDHWLSAGELRQSALGSAGLNDVLFLKEKLSAAEDTANYKLEAADADGTLYTVKLDARSGLLIKFTAESLDDAKPARIISAKDARSRVLNYIGGLRREDVVFTKSKLDNGLYLIGFTLDDGTQYLAEVVAETGEISNLDQHAAPANLTESVGLLAARDAALKMAELGAEDNVTFTKAKIDRRDGAYVYELEFETQRYEYEAVLNAADGAMLKYRLLPK